MKYAHTASINLRPANKIDGALTGSCSKFNSVNVRKLRPHDKLRASFDESASAIVAH